MKVSELETEVQEELDKEAVEAAKKALEEAIRVRDNAKRVYKRAEAKLEELRDADISEFHEGGRYWRSGTGIMVPCTLTSRISYDA